MSEDIKSKLKPCPFCGCDEPTMQIAVGEWWGRCPRCLMTTRAASNKPAAVKAWNTRTSSTTLDLRVAVERIIRASLDVAAYPTTNAETVVAMATDGVIALLNTTGSAPQGLSLHRPSND